MTSFLAALRAEFPAPSSTASFVSKNATIVESPRALLPSAGKVTADQRRTFRDPFLSSDQLWEISTPTHHRDLLKVLQVDHDGLRAANEREAAVGAVVTSKRQKPKDQKPKAKKDTGELLLAACAQHTAANSDSCFLTTLELAESVLQTVQDSPDADTVQAQLFGLVGVEGMDLIAFAVQNQKELSSSSVTKQKLQDAQNMLEMAENYASGGARPTGFSIQTEAEQQFQRQQRKAQRRANRQNGEEEEEVNWLEAAGYDPEVLRLQREFAEEERRLQSSSLVQREFGALQGGYDSTAAAGQLSSAGALTLPSSTKRTHYKGYEHVFIPAHAKKALGREEKLVAISSLEAFAQTAFHGITTLNRLQSKLFNAAYNSNQNLLVCAPTGAGKTNVAMLTILQEVKTQLNRPSSQGVANMKIIYVAPMKALAQEVVTKFGQRLQALKLKVRELTGDMQLTKREIEETHVIVTTPEKWDVITRKSSTQQSLLSQVKLLIIDEVHLLADERGPVIETIVARTLRRVESTQSMIRIVGLSATLPNYVDVASFLRVYVPSGDSRMQNAATNGGKGGLFFFDSTYRPVPLDQTFIGVSTNANLKEALGLSAAALSTVAASEEDLAKEKKAAGATMSRQRQIQLMMNKLTLAHCLKQVQHNEQVMVFVHSRKETAATMHSIVELARGNEEEPGTLEAFLPPLELQMPINLQERVQKSRNKELKELLGYGMGIHHAGMLRSDRNLTEQLFELGYIRVLCCTATLAWGVNLPAHSVLIKGTQVYNADKGGMTQLSMLDVMQIFGRAGRPQYDTSGDAVLVTTQDQLPHYLRLLTTGIPMESALIKALPDHLNAEIVSGTVSNLDEACTWLSYTYLYVRMRKNPLAYGMKLDDVNDDPMLITRRRQLLMDAAEKLAACRMIKILREKVQLDSDQEGKIAFAVTSMGRVASHFYIQHTSIETFNDLLDSKAGQKGEDEDDLDWEKVLLVLCSSNEFEQLKSREEEMPELEKLKRRFCRFDVLGGGMDTYTGKTNILLQSLIGRARVTSFTLISDTNYVAQNGSRVCRALFEICLKKNSARKAEKFLQLAKCIDQKMWFDQNAMLQLPNVPLDIIGEVDRRHNMSLYDAVVDPDAFNLNSKIKKWAQSVPFIDIDNVQTQPFGGNMIKLTFELYPLFPEWKEGVFQGKTLASWLWVEDAVTGYIYHSEYSVLHQSRFLGWKAGTQTLEIECYLPVFISQTQTEANYVIRILSDRFVGIESFYEVSYKPSESTVTDKKEEMYTKLLRLHPQPLQSLDDPVYQALYVGKFQYFNPIQTQTFHQLYHQSGNVLLCAPTGSGKTVCAELAMLRVWKQLNENGPGSSSRRSSPSLIVYIAPMKALAREKVAEWKTRFENNAQLRKKVVEVTGDTLVNVDFILNKADIVVTTPEKWDLLTRSSTIGRALMSQMALVVVDEVHLVGEAPRGAVLEVLISRLRRFKRSGPSIRVIGLSTALANAGDVGRWLGGVTSSHANTPEAGQVYNFRASVRPVPMDVHIQGFPERHYVARMAAMNKPTFMAIKAHSPDKPVLIFVSSKAQTKLTALDLIQFCVADDGGKRFLKMDEAVMDSICQSNQIVDETLKHTLSFGIGLHHAGLARRDRELVEKLYKDRLIQVVISTSTLAWGVNLPAHLVVIKGTEYFQNGRYRSYPLSDLLQMIGRAGRPLLDDKGVACVLVEESKKNMTQRFLYEPLAVESCLGGNAVLANHLNAEIAAGLIHSTKDVMDYLSWSLLFQRVLKNPSFYGVGTEVAVAAKPGKQNKPSKTPTKQDELETFFQHLISTTMEQLEASQCVTAAQTDGVSSFEPTFAGKLAASLYVDIRTVSNMLSALQTVTTEKTIAVDKTLLLLCVICESSVELRGIPLRHNEVMSNLITDLCAKVKYSPLKHLFASAPKRQKALLETHGSEVKALLVLEMHLMGLRLPSSDFVNDLRTVLDHLPRLVSAAIDLCAYLKLTDLVFAGIRLSQSVVQGRWPNDSEVLTQLPHASQAVVKLLREEFKISDIAELQAALAVTNKKTQILERLQSLQSLHSQRGGLTKHKMNEFIRVAEGVPRLRVDVQKKKQQVDVEMTGLNDRGVKTLAFTSRLQKPKPYGFYVLLTTKGGELVHVKHVAWKHKVKVSLSLPTAGVEYEVHVLSDAIAGIDSSHV
ncbi:Activating signal cointegrator 1 complex subunit 3 [Phytophthora cactorum]|uniref:Activating signal cointegrator 1 complex subunit 3 n=2 Tax=Phytophthora cactorum TaxID=29920 RepID=A0A329RGB8_9STRA|nr:Activating signal cointegrator 1 complex subunit 3 [Phytophthora cactorum]KAG2802351.1 Activating signal cointegrator 1 complex subunit 3 [Phytophthora cactorum]KAG2812740.1 Activating signal cointegrator 1 complex subunit 3 [Phytophthora cactorum]KAG2852980.1 Activating signal cointegrator 1 complex subunit 3 [Phytophthora cactorum]KAG2895374.1 Activating signal cointegrator 1 complex subunit 3 [Phytophthora cactorum]